MKYRGFSDAEGNLIFNFVLLLLDYLDYVELSQLRTSNLKTALSPLIFVIIFIKRGTVAARLNLHCETITAAQPSLCKLVERKHFRLQSFLSLLSFL